MNACHTKLGYRVVDAEWNAQPAPRVSFDGDIDRDAIAIRQVLGAGAAPLCPCSHDEQIADDRALLVLEDLRVCWTVALASGSVFTCDRSCRSIGWVLADSTTLRAVVTGELNVGSALRTGVMRAKGRMTMVASVIEALRAARPRTGARP
jgi:hypothetical protein